jgi:hypothetical protein
MMEDALKGHKWSRVPVGWQDKKIADGLNAYKVSYPISTNRKMDRSGQSPPDPFI